MFPSVVEIHIATQKIGYSDTMFIKMTSFYQAVIHNKCAGTVNKRSIVDMGDL